MIKQIDLINLSHYDIGFTDHPLVCREVQRRYIDMALDLISAKDKRPAGEAFCWTVESNDVLLAWWQASGRRHQQLLRAIQAGRVEVCAMPFNQTPAMNARQWRTMTHWLPDELAQQLQMKTAIQDDVNGMPRAGAVALLDAGIEYLWMAINQDTGGSPLPQPSAAWWQMPDGRRIFIWNSMTYPSGYSLFESDEWRKGPLPLAADTRYRPPRTGDFFLTTPEYLERAQGILAGKLAAWEEKGYTLERMAVSMTNMWRIDNDPPCQMLPDFVAAWNAAGLSPRLNLTTPTVALKAIQEEAGETLPTLSGEWPDWWANGAASMPQELSASRKAKRLVTALESPLYAPSEDRQKVAEECTRQLCLFDEHTFGSWNAAAKPGTLDARGQLAEKTILAHRPLVMAELALGDANRALGAPEKGLRIVNPYGQPFTGWVTLTNDCLRGEYAGVEEVETGKQTPFYRTSGASPFYTRPTDASQFTPTDEAKVFPDNIEGKRLRLWVENLGSNATRDYVLRAEVAPKEWDEGPAVVCDHLGWPVSATWPGLALFRESLGDFSSLEFEGLAPRYAYKDVLVGTTVEARRSSRERLSKQVTAVAKGPARMHDTGPTVVYEQYLYHRRLRWLRRRLELVKATPRANLTVEMDRLSKPEAAEVFYLRFRLPCDGIAPEMTTGGMPFTPGDIMPHACRDFFAIDGTLNYLGMDATRVLVCQDNALVSIGGMHDGLMLEQSEGDPDCAYAILYNNVWYTNFPGDQSGVMTFRFDLYDANKHLEGLAPRAFAVVNV